MTQLYWTQGQFNLVSVIESPDEASAAAFRLAIASSGNIRMQTLRAFNRSEMNNILAKLA